MSKLKLSPEEKVGVLYESMFRDYHCPGVVFSFSDARCISSGARCRRAIV